jgi:hypothetical protein
MTDMTDKKTITVKRETWERLFNNRQPKAGARNESLDEIISRALECLDHHREGF